jgi:O-succinylhomoserine sulfhydrylase
MVAMDLGSQERAWRFMDSLTVARVGSSFGGVRSEVTHPATTSHRQFSSQDRKAAGITDGLVRISAGIEDVDDLIEDFEQALSKK